MLRLIPIVVLIFITTASFAEKKKLPIATLNTSMGVIRIKLYESKTPKTVDNFVGLATGTKSYVEASTGKRVTETPFYKDMIFHKIHPRFVIQSGCPWKDGRGWPGFYLEDEIRKDLKFDRAGIVAMAKKDQSVSDNPPTSGSQFFITLKPLPHLDGKHTIFGEVIAGMDVVKKISSQPYDTMMKPKNDIALTSIKIE